MAETIVYRHNVMNINSIDTFLSIKGGFNRGQRDVYFVRVLGRVQNIENSIVDIDKRMDIEAKSKRLSYKRIKTMPLIQSQEDVSFYAEQYDRWKNKRSLYLKNNNTALFSDVLYDALTIILNSYRRIKPSLTESIERNLAAKMLFWMDNILGDTLNDWEERKCYKVIVENISKDQDYLFCYLMTLIGCDVLMLQYNSDVNIIDELKNKSISINAGSFGNLNIPEYKPYKEEQVVEKVSIQNTTGKSAVSASQEQVKPKPVSIARPDRDNKTRQSNIKVEAAKAPVKSNVKTGSELRQEADDNLSKRTVVNTSTDKTKKNTEKSFEELAMLASSVVMITVFNRSGEPEATGSGIMIGKDGYILTNNHVVEGGAIFAVQIEDDDNVYPADSVIKTNKMLDLAIIRISKKLKPIPIYNGKKKLVRGQKVVAIGSPLGLFNSVSDGIISGFRTINDVDMIQFTAPISHGSSGGAVLNMQGQIIGISTAGIDKGQNINLAVDYENILIFARGFY